MDREEAARYLGIRYVHLMRLLREGKIQRSPDGMIEPDSLAVYRSRVRPPNGYVSARVAALDLGVAREHIHRLVEHGVLAGRILPRSMGGAWVEEEALEAVELEDVAGLGIMIRPPQGWLTSHEACLRLHCGRSTLLWFVRQGKIERRMLSHMNSWYREQDVTRLHAAA